LALTDPGNLLLPVSLVWVASEIMLARAKRSGAADQAQDRNSLRVLWLTIAIAVTGGVIVGTQRAGHLDALDLPLRWLGLALIVAGLALRWYAIRALGKQFTVNVAITQGHQLVRGGIYGVLRHPSYTGSLLSFLGLGLSFANGWSVAIIFLPILLAFSYRIRVEEAALLAEFGAEYREYCRSTKRLVPGVW
jgi:protein-S-isoprenylcysteine O-methyltransferase